MRSKTDTTEVGAVVVGSVDAVVVVPYTNYSYYYDYVNNYSKKCQPDTVALLTVLYDYIQCRSRRVSAGLCSYRVWDERVCSCPIDPTNEGRVSKV